jgi:hypothetical protein
VVIIMNHLYAGEIQAELQRANLSPETLLA